MNVGYEEGRNKLVLISGERRKKKKKAQFEDVINFWSSL